MLASGAKAQRPGRGDRAAQPRGPGNVHKPPPQVDLEDIPKQAPETETRRPVGNTQPPAQGGAAGTQQTGLMASFRVKIQGPPVWQIPVCKISRRLPIANRPSAQHSTAQRRAACSTPHHTKPHHATPPLRFPTSSEVLGLLPAGSHRPTRVLACRAHAGHLFRPVSHR